MGHGSWTSRAVAARCSAPRRPRLVPPAASVGVDFSPEMVLAARASLGDGVEVQVMDAEQLDFDDGSFDAVLCSFGVFFFPSPERAVAEMHRVLVSGGTVRAVVVDAGRRAVGVGGPAAP